MSLRVRRSLAVVGALGAVWTGAASAAYDPSDPGQRAAHDEAFQIGVRAHDYGVALLSMDRLYRSSTSVNVPDGRGSGPVNVFSTFRRLADERDRSAVAPSNDTLYSAAWLDLSRGPVVLHLDPSPRRYRYLELLSPYQENFANVGSPAKALKGSDFLVTPPGWRGRVPERVKRIRSPYDRAWVVGRTLVRDASDLAGARRVARTFLITPLARWDPGDPVAYRAPAPRHPDTTLDRASTPGTTEGEDPLVFFDALNRQLARFPPPAADAPVLEALGAWGIGPGRPAVSTSTALSDAQRAGLAAAVTGAEARLQARLGALMLSGFERHNGWLVFTGGGRYGTDYATRALIDRFGFGSPTPDVAIYPLAALDRDRAPLTGEKRYVVHFPAEHARPPVQFFWSLTMYGSDLFFVPNAIDRWLLNDRSRLVRNPNGSLDVYVQQDPPASARQRRNWLPSPPGAFRLVMRLYGLSATALAGIADGTGWRPPSILPCDAGGSTSAGIACAR